MGRNDTQFIDFFKYCATCKYKDTDEIDDPCNECLDIGAKEGSGIPEKYEEAKK